MEVVKDDGFVTMAEVLPRNERTEKIIAQRAAENAAKQEKAEQVSYSQKFTQRYLGFAEIGTSLDSQTVSKFELLNLKICIGTNSKGARGERQKEKSA